MSILYWFTTVLSLLWMSNAAKAEPVRIAAASSLATALGELTETHDVRITFGPSQRLARQAELGMDVDLILLAHPIWADSVEASGLIAAQTPLLSNALVVVGEHPLSSAKRIGIGGQGVPIGDYARSALTTWGMMPQVQDRLINSPSAAALLTQVKAGLLDAAIVYESDAVSTPELTVKMRIPEGSHDPIVYSLLMTKNGASRPESKRVFHHLQSDKMMGAFSHHGFSRHRTEKPSSLTPTTPNINKTSALMRSLWVAGWALSLAFFPALSLGWLLARRRFPGKSLINTVCLLPLVLPPVVTGWLLLKAAHWAGVGIAFTPWAAVIAAAVVGFPLMLILIRGAIESVDVRYEHQAQTLGLTTVATFWKVTLPMALPGIAAGCVLAGARALGEFGATALFAGDQPEQTRTIALAVYAAAELPGGETAAADLVALSIGITLIALLAYERLVWHQLRTQEEWK